MKIYLKHLFINTHQNYRSLVPVIMFITFLLLPAITVSSDESKLSFLAKIYEKTFQFSTLITAQTVRDDFSTDEGVDKAIQWCKETGVTRVFIETFRNGYMAKEEDMIRGRDAFKKAGFITDGCVTTTGIGVESNGWKLVSNYEMPKTLEECEKIFRFTASLFDVIMIDDFLFTDDTTEISEKARGERSWADYRCDLMLRASHERILKPAREVNPNVKVIIKYPQWYDNFHNRGYDVDAQTRDFDIIWVGTETRDPDSKQWGRKAQYEAFFIMQWLTDVGGAKTGGGWFDPYGTNPKTYVEQARQTILGGARDALLFNYKTLLSDEHADNVVELRKELPLLFELAKLIHGAKPTGVLAVKIPNSDAPKEMYIYDFLGMLGIPMAPLSTIDAAFPCALFATQSWKQGVFPRQFNKFITDGKPVLLTHNMKDLLQSKHLEIPKSVKVIQIPQEPRDLYKLDSKQLEEIRKPLLKALGMEISGPTCVSLYLYDNGVMAVENFNDTAVTFSVKFDRPLSVSELSSIKNKALALPRKESVEIENNQNSITFKLQPRSLGVVQLEENRLKRK